MNRSTLPLIRSRLRGACGGRFMQRLMAVIWLLFLLGFSPAGWAQVRLNSGGVYTYTFPSLPLVDVRPNTGSLLAMGRLSVAGNSLQWQAGNTVRLELFENSLTQPPVEIGLISFPLETGLLVGQGAVAAWQDRQGSIRITSVAGSVTIDKIILESWIPVDASRTSYNYYRSEFTPATDTVVLDLERVGTSLRLSWPRGTLVEATNIAGPWTTNQATSPLIVVPGGPQKFYRVRVF